MPVKIRVVYLPVVDKTQNRSRYSYVFAEAGLLGMQATSPNLQCFKQCMVLDSYLQPAPSGIQKASSDRLVKTGHVPEAADQKRSPM